MRVEASSGSGGGGGSSVQITSHSSGMSSFDVEPKYVLSGEFTPNSSITQLFTISPAPSSAVSVPNGIFRKDTATITRDITVDTNGNVIASSAPAQGYIWVVNIPITWT